VPGFVTLLEGSLPSGRYHAADLGFAGGGSEAA
jgi:hypothetical protein